LSRFFTANLFHVIDHSHFKIDGGVLQVLRWGDLLTLKVEVS
jgi:hypothetical protein